jgi:hypothetical protein
MRGLRARGGAGCAVAAELALLAEVHWLSLLLKALGSAADLRLSLAGSRLVRVAGSVAAGAGA